MSKDIIEIINDNVTFLEYYEKQRKEIERLKELDQEHQKLNGELRVENKRLNNIIKDIKNQLDYLETYSSKEDVFEDMKRRLDRIENIVNRK